LAFTDYDPETVRALSEALAGALRYIEKKDSWTLANEGRSVVTKALVDRLLLAAATGERDPGALKTMALCGSAPLSRARSNNR
jgi:hypothetical protein